MFICPSAYHGMTNIESVTADARRKNIINIPIIPEMDCVLEFSFIERELHVLNWYHSKPMEHTGGRRVLSPLCIPAPTTHTVAMVIYHATKCSTMIRQFFDIMSMVSTTCYRCLTTENVQT